MKINFIYKHKIISLIIGVLFISSIMYLAYPLITSPKISVIKTEPPNNQQGISIKPTIYITFDKELSDKEKETIQISTFPEFESKKEVVGNRIIIVPINDLEKGVFYKMDVFYNKKNIYSFMFETTLFTREQILKEGALQTADDILFGDAYKIFIKDFTWYQSLPIEEPEYRIVYDFEKKSFRIRILNNISDEVLQTKIEEAVQNLYKIGVQKPIEYYVLDINGNPITPLPALSSEDN